jgi:glyoxylase-like metal-dependent hydrolase (beta-lactamase superfamily II)
MLKRIVLGLALVIVVLASLAALALVSAHRAIDRERAPLPTAEELARFATGPVPDLPVRLRWIDTATQAMPRSAVLDPGADPAPDEPYVMSHPAFVLEWADGRLLLIDAGMRREAALEFGGPLEALGGASPIEPRTSVADALGASAANVGGIVFTHLHTDHVEGVLGLCTPAREQKLAAFTTVAQAERSNYTTRPGIALLEEATCVERRVLSEDRLRALPGFPGVAVLDAGGHTPGSQIVLARVRGQDPDAGERLYAFAGDTVNHIDGVRHDVPKPYLYRTLLVPESDDRLGELRRFLAGLERDGGWVVLVSHDQRALAAALGGS